jgi:predicted RNase H-like HicB family nuclease
VKYRVVLYPSEEGFAANCPALPGCWSQGRTEVEAKDNIREAIRLWLEVAEEDALNPEEGLAIAAGVTV